MGSRELAKIGGYCAKASRMLVMRLSSSDIALRREALAEESHWHKLLSACICVRANFSCSAAASRYVLA